MAFLFNDPDVIATLRGDDHHPIYNFVEIGVVSTAYPSGIYLTSFESDVSGTTLPDKNSGTSHTWDSRFLGNIAPPARTGNVTQEIQKLELNQGLGSFTEAYADLLTAMGANFHNAPIVITSLLLKPNGTFATSEPITRTNGIIKSLSRNVKDNTVVVEFSNSFGKLDGLNELRTTPGSLDRRSSSDTSFDKAGTSIDRVMLKWGV
jgi:hypothetical protein